MLLSSVRPWLRIQGLDLRYFVYAVCGDVSVTVDSLPNAFRDRQATYEMIARFARGWLLEALIRNPQDLSEQGAKSPSLKIC